MSAVKKHLKEEAPPAPPAEGYDLWRARRDLERYIFDQGTSNGQVAPELLRLRDFLRHLAGED